MPITIFRPRTPFKHGLGAVLCLTTMVASPIAHAQTFTVDFASKMGEPTYRASGFIYGLSEDATKPSQKFLTDIKTKFFRVGGAQLGCPNGGWVNSTANYTRQHHQGQFHQPR